ncbi:MAG: hypothetical protein AABX71_02240, partial [Nanoarchaeota archaeon]
MKKIGVLIIFLLLLNILAMTITLAQETPPGMPSILNPGEAEKKIEEAKNKTETTWDYLSKEWKKMLLGNKFVSALDSFFTKISSIFLILFGEGYALSLTLFIIIILWIYFFLKFAEILRDFSAFSSGTSWLISLGIVAIMAQTKILRKIVEFFMWLILAKEAVWWRILMTGIIVFALILIYAASSYFSRIFKEQKEELEKEQEKTERKTLHKVVE